MRMAKNALQLSDIDKKQFTLEQLRERMRPFDALDIINEVQDIVRDQWEVLGKNQIDALKLQVDIQCRKLSKVLPDLKAMDHSVGESASKVNFIINLDGASPNKETKRL
jgi:hypothetical protein